MRDVLSEDARQTIIARNIVNVHIVNIGFLLSFVASRKPVNNEILSVVDNFSSGHIKLGTSR